MIDFLEQLDGSRVYDHGATKKYSGFGWSFLHHCTGTCSVAAEQEFQAIICGKAMCGAETCVILNGNVSLRSSLLALRRAVSDG